MKIELALMLADEARSKGVEAQSLHEKALVALADELVRARHDIIVLKKNMTPEQLAKLGYVHMTEDAKRALNDYPSGQFQAASQE